MNVANILADSHSCDVIVAGGVLRRSDGGLVGDLTKEAIETFKVDFAIIGTSALDAGRRPSGLRQCKKSG